MRAKRIVITGAAGNIGGKLRAYLAAAGYDLVLIDRDARGDGSIVEADLTASAQPWTEYFAGADAVVHLAANADAGAAWPDVIGPNVIATMNVYQAAAAHGVYRVVFASSVWAMARRRDDNEAIDEGPATPGNNPYGASKAICEQIAEKYAEMDGVESVVIRLGACSPGANEPWPMNPWDDACWVSNRDMCQGFALALEAKIGKFLIVNLTSNNAARRWSLANARAMLGYAPRDGFVPRKKAALLSRVRGKLALLLKRRYRRAGAL